MIVPPLDLGPGFLQVTLAICVLCLAGTLVLVGLNYRRRNMAASSIFSLGAIAVLIIVLILGGL